MKITITQAQLLAFVAFARAAVLELVAMGERFVAEPTAELTKWCAMLGYELVITLDPAAHVGEPNPAEVAAALEGLGHTPASSSTPSSMPAPLPKVVLPKRRATPEEAAGYERLLQGAKHFAGVPLRPAGDGSFFVMLDDGREVVLPRHALEFAGATPPDASSVDDVSPETVKAWEDVIAGRTGRVVAVAAAGNFVVRFEDGQEITLPHRALPLAGCDAPK